MNDNSYRFHIEPQNENHKKFKTKKNQKYNIEVAYELLLDDKKNRK